MLQNRGKLSVAVRIRVDGTFPGEVAIVEALTAGIVPANQASPIAVGAIALLVEVNEAAKLGNRATGVVQAVKAHPHEVEVEVAEAPLVAAEEAEEAVVAVGAPAAVAEVAEAAVAADAGN